MQEPPAAVYEPEVVILAGVPHAVIFLPSVPDMFLYVVEPSLFVTDHDF